MNRRFSDVGIYQEDSVIKLLSKAQGQIEGGQAFAFTTNGTGYHQHVKEGTFLGQFDNDGFQLAVFFRSLGMRIIYGHKQLVCNRDCRSGHLWRQMNLGNIFHYRRFRGKFNPQLCRFFQGFFYSAHMISFQIVIF